MVIAVVIVLGLTFGVAVGAYFWVEQRKRASGPMEYPAVGDCVAATSALFIEVDEGDDPVRVLDCADPTATWKVVESNLEEGGYNSDLQCEIGDVGSIHITDDHYGEQHSARVCTVPNLQPGRCYEHSGILEYTYAPSCGDRSARFDREVRGATDVAVCEPAFEGERPSYLGGYHHADKTNRVVYCFGYIE
ncbi:hypothetical protein [Nocardia sp. NPDC051750]|uniref:hypothetical protein n=1 Tax=Nocardia sp. NPDC051750 TaxID=3364325 RepID=UPI0037B2FF31